MKTLFYIWRRTNSLDKKKNALTGIILNIRAGHPLIGEPNVSAKNI
jgi:hypothetical protein